MDSGGRGVYFVFAMPVINCLCGQRLEGNHASYLSAALRAHFEDAHPDRAVPEEWFSGFVARMSEVPAWDGKTRTPGEPIVVRALSPEALADYLAFFDRDAFADNPFWSSCYCYTYHFSGTNEEWERRASDENRDAKSGLISNGEAQGYLAYAGDRVIGWCHAAPRATLPGINKVEEFRVDDPERAGSIVCFVVSPMHRRQGIAGKLLDAACDGFRAQGLAFAEAYPPKRAVSDARAYHGPLQMYLGHGFSPLREGERYVIVRKDL